MQSKIGSYEQPNKRPLLGILFDRPRNQFDNRGYCNNGVSRYHRGLLRLVLVQRKNQRRMKTRYITYIIILGAVLLYYAKVLIQSSVNATSDSFDAYFSLLGWSMYLVGWLMFVGGHVAFGVKLIKSIFDD
jgi:hypothetical protein